MGYEVNVVLSNSMEPIYTTGELLLVRPATANEIKVNNIISYSGSRNTDNVITHRVVGINQKEQVFFTKGDANDSQDSNPVAFTRLKGIVETNIPYLGLVYGVFQLVSTKIILVSLILIYIIVDLLIKRRICSSNSEEELK